MHLTLIGFMGTGKTHVGQRLAARLGWEFLDTDALVEASFGMPIAEIFQTHGEAAFREAEQDALSDALRPLQPVVLATGGGTPCAEGAMEWIRRRSLVVHLNPPLEVVLARLEAEVEHRPMLQGKRGADLAAWVQRMMLTRAACYGAAHAVWTADLTSDDALDEALASIQWRLDLER
jgi:shikimate kinase